ncbi:MULTISPECIES: hemin uptake protein HemP [unclassified Polynucleobacter]|nr:MULTISPECIES: hemin uptake protein HemP [unclassified Polynucleobacter]
MANSELKPNASCRDLPQIISSKTLLGPKELIFIEHDGHRYQLRITKLRKLILTK